MYACFDFIFDCIALLTKVVDPEAAYPLRALLLVIAELYWVATASLSLSRFSCYCPFLNCCWVDAVLLDFWYFIAWFVAEEKLSFRLVPIDSLEELCDLSFFTSIMVVLLFKGIVTNLIVWERKASCLGIVMLTFCVWCEVLSRLELSNDCWELWSVLPCFICLLAEMRAWYDFCLSSCERRSVSSGFLNFLSAPTLTALASMHLWELILC